MRLFDPNGTLLSSKKIKTARRRGATYGFYLIAGDRGRFETLNGRPLVVRADKPIVVVASGPKDVVVAPAPTIARGAPPKVIVGESIAGVSPGMTRSDVVAKLGPPVYPAPPLNRSDHGATCGSNGIPQVDYFYPLPSLSRGLTVEFKAKSCRQRGRQLTIKRMGRVTYIAATTGRTDDGIGVGSPFAAVKATLGAHARCIGRRGARALCFVPAGANGVSTRFLFASGRVSKIEMQLETPARSGSGARG
jgi:hypothetical protein